MQRLLYLELEVEARDLMHAKSMAKRVTEHPSAQVEEKWKLLEARECTRGSS